MTRFKYSPIKFWQSLMVAVGLTIMVTGLTWMIFTRLGNPNAGTITAVAGLVFLAFFSARMAVGYFGNQIVLAILPTGIEDGRWGNRMVAWEQIKELSLTRRENEFRLNISLWPQNGAAELLQIELDALESDVDIIVAAIAQYIPVQNKTTIDING